MKVNCRRYLFYLLCTIVLCAAGYGLFELLRLDYHDHIRKTGTFWEKLRSSPPNEIGDTLAGMFGSLAFFAAAVAIVLQSAELKSQRLEFEKMNVSLLHQRFETTFFEMLSSLRLLVEGLDVGEEGDPLGRVTGRQVFRHLKDDLEKSIGSVRPQELNEKCTISLGYDIFWNDNRLNLSHYFRFLYNFCRFLEDNSELTSYHAKLLRSQLSDEELTLLFYNCISVPGKKFEHYAVLFELFDNIEQDDLFHPSHAHLIHPGVFGPDKRGLLK